MQEKIKNKPLRNKPIGIFDSGLGGLTVMSEINKTLPDESIIYFGDTARVPYGSKSKNAVINFSKEISGFLVKNGVKMIVIACNTASAFALYELKKNLDIPVIGVIEPGAEIAVSATKNKKIGIIGTEGTVKSESYVKAIKKISNSSVYQQSCPLFVPLVEEGWTKNELTDSIVKYYLKPLLSKNIDTLVLGCTHYPLLKNAIQKNTGKNIVLIDSAKATAQKVKNILINRNMLADKNNSKKLSFYVSDNPEKFKRIGSRFFSGKISRVKKENPEQKCNTNFR
ncbi:MAG: glutamate racemase [Endomicrobia bacterium]|nr:glutamate racemase [Endomicrobiia bacterium]MCL2799522.1 glutamate racemase [Endomicrobiia bacterium]